MKQKQIDQLSILDRATAPTPKFFRILKYIGLTLATIGGTILAAPVPIPPLITTIAGYVALAGTVVTAVSQLAVEG